MKAGRLRHRVLIQKPVNDSDTVTDEIPEYEDVAWRNAEVRPVTAREIFAAQGFIGQNDLMVVIRYEPMFDDLNNRWRIWFQNRRLDIAGKVNPDMSDRWLRIPATCDQSHVRLRSESFNEPVNNAVHVVLPGLQDD